MRGQRVRPLTASDVVKLPSWSRQACSLITVESTGPDAWTRAAMDRFGLCGVAMRDGNDVLGWLLICPSLNVPAGHGLDQGPRPASVAMLLGMQVHPDQRGVGIGKTLVRQAASRLVTHACGIECLGAVGVPSCEAPPRGFLTEVGFHTVAITPAATLSAPVRMRLDLDSTVVRPRRDLKSVVSSLTGWAHNPAPGSAVRGVADADDTPVR